LCGCCISFYEHIFIDNLVSFHEEAVLVGHAGRDLLEYAVSPSRLVSPSRSASASSLLWQSPLPHNALSSSVSAATFLNNTPAASAGAALLTRAASAVGADKFSSPRLVASLSTPHYSPSTPLVRSATHTAIVTSPTRSASTAPVHALPVTDQSHRKTAFGRSASTGRSQSATSILRISEQQQSMASLMTQTSRVCVCVCVYLYFMFVF
jgi:hypothetical protein